MAAMGSSSKGSIVFLDGINLNFLIIFARANQRVNTDGETKEDLRNKDRIFSASFAFLAIASIIIRLEKHTIRQINPQNLINLIYLITYSNKMTRNGRKTASYYSASFPPHYRRTLFTTLSFVLCGANLVSIMANLIPIEALGPCPNGK